MSALRAKWWWAAAAVLVTAALVTFVLSGGDDGPARRTSDALDEAAPAARTARDVELASSSVATDEPLAAADRTAAGTRQVATVEGARALRWGDLLRPVDALDGRELEGVRVAHARVVAAERAEPEWSSLDTPLTANDFAAPGYLVVDAPAHVPAIFSVDELLRGEPPARVVLSPSASVILQVESRAARTSPTQITSCSLAFLQTMRDDEYAWRHGAALTTVCEVGAHDFERGEYRIVAGDYWRIASSYASIEAMRLDGAHMSVSPEIEVGRFADRPTECTLPTVCWIDEALGERTFFADLPAGKPLQFGVTADVPFEFEPAAEWADFREEPAAIVLEPGEVRVVTVRLVGSASLVGTLPLGSHAGSVVLMQRTLDGSRLAADSLDALEAGEFRFDGLRPGSWTATIAWTDADGGRVLTQHAFELVAGETYDLGVLAPNRGHDVTIVPRVEIGGVPDPTLFGGVLLDTDWRIDHSTGRMTDALESASVSRLEPLILRGIDDAEFVVSFDRPNLPPAAAESLRFVEWRYTSHHVLEGPLTIEATLCLAFSPRVPVTFVLPQGAASPFTRVRALARRVDGDDVRAVEGTRDITTRASGELVGAYANLEPGIWEFCAAIGTQSPFEEDDDERSWYGSTRAAISVGMEPVRVALAPAATVVFGPNFDWRGNEPNGFFQVAPVDAPDALAPLAYPWTGDGVTHDAAVDGLAPDTEYRVLGSEVRFRTGAGGSRTVLE